MLFFITFRLAKYINVNIKEIKMQAKKIIGTMLVVGMLSACSFMGDKYSVYFAPGSTDLSPAQKTALFKAAKQAKSEGKSVKLSGYTDSTGSKEMNRKISKKRVMKVSKELEKLGVSPMNISKHAKGEGWWDKDAKNDRKMRRVEISVY